MAETWQGFRFPARLLTDEEKEVLTPVCAECGLPAIVIELNAPLTDEYREASAVAIPEDDARTLCALHTQMPLPTDLAEKTKLDFFMSMTVYIPCERASCKKMACSCLAYASTCAKNCAPLKRLLDGMKLSDAETLIVEGRALYDLKKKEKKDAASS